MSKVLLIFEDYSLLNRTQADLKKAGLDTSGVTSGFSIFEQILSFNPDLVIALGKGPKVSTLGVGRKLKDMNRWQGKVLLVFPAGFKPTPDDILHLRMDLMLEAPVPAQRLIQVCANLIGLNEQDLLQRYTAALTAEAERIADTAKRESSDKIAVTAKGARLGQAPAQNPDDPLAAFDQAANNWGKKAPAVGGESWLQNKKSENIMVRSKSTGPGNASGFISGGQSSASDMINVEGGDPSAEPRQAKGSSEFENTNEPDLPNMVRGGGESAASKGVSGGLGQERSSTSVSGKQSSMTSESQPEYSVSTDPEMAEVIANVAQELAGAQAMERERTLQYEKLTKGITVPRESTLGRKSAKARLNALKKDWSQAELDDQDVNRREFTKALFKKK